MAGSYSLFELGQVLLIPGAHDVILFLDSLFRGSQEQLGLDVLAYTRIRSLASESSYFGMYVGVILPWFLKDVLQGSRSSRIKESLFVVYMLILTIFSVSRTAYVMVAVEIAIFAFFERRRLISLWKYIFPLILVIILIGSYFLAQESTLGKIDITAVFISLISSEGTGYDLSNIARIGTQSAAFNLWLDYPLFGVGYGAFGFYATDYYPAWAWFSNEVVSWTADTPGTSWIPTHGLYPRLLSETGLVGFLAYVGAYIVLIKNAYAFGKTTTGKRNVLDSYCTIITMCIFILFGINIDSIRYLFMWIFFATIWAVKDSSHVSVSDKDEC